MGEMLDALKRLQANEGVMFCTIEDGQLRGRGTVKVIRRESLNSCPHTILMPNHYREDGSCRCDDPNHARMIDWGYEWNGLMWEGKPCDDQD